jgi:hypothetical protein
LTLAVVGSLVLGTVVKFAIGFRPSTEDEEEGLDAFDHGEAGYAFDEGFASHEPAQPVTGEAAAPALAPKQAGV